MYWVIHSGSALWSWTAEAKQELHFCVFPSTSHPPRFLSQLCNFLPPSSPCKHMRPAHLSPPSLPPSSSTSPTPPSHQEISKGLNAKQRLQPIPTERCSACAWMCITAKWERSSSTWFPRSCCESLSTLGALKYAYGLCLSSADVHNSRRQPCDSVKCLQVLLTMMFNMQTEALTFRFSPQTSELFTVWYSLETEVMMSGLSSNSWSYTDMSYSICFVYHILRVLTHH